MWGSTSNGFKFRQRLDLYQDGKNNEFNLKSFKATSYNHWLYCTKIKGKVVFNDYNYSVTTNAHQRNLKDLFKELGIKIDLMVSMRDNLHHFDTQVLKNVYTEMFQIEIDGLTARKRNVYSICLQESFDTRESAIEALKVHVKACKKLGASISKAEIKSIKDRVVSNKDQALKSSREKSRVKAELKKSLIPSLKNLDEINLGFDKMSGLNEINLTGGF